MFVRRWQSGWNCMLYKYFPPDLSHVTIQPLILTSHRHQLRWWRTTQSFFLLMIQRNGTVFRNFEASAGVMGLHANWHKTKIRNIGTGVAPRTVYIDNQAVETVSRFTYLGSDIDSDGYSYPEIHRHLGIAGFIMAQLDKVWRQQRLGLSTKLRIYSLLCSR